MRAALAFALILVAHSAQAAYPPADKPRQTAAPDVYAMYTGPAGAMLESDYFRAPRVSDGRNISCRLEIPIFEKTRLAQACN